MNNPLVQLDPGLFVWTIVTFLLLLTVLSKFAWKPLLKMLKEREEFIRSSLEDAEKAQTELAKLNAEGEEIINKARAEAQT
ncbi:MAG TPA: F0F1 ATP synthase subunit B, partial [Candidatus Marinimicrobia bacterium]|nr:F0F1 ATP synthase subunit B [Candidatus Neomarinimicrobiota bacterium]